MMIPTLHLHISILSEYSLSQSRAVSDKIFDVILDLLVRILWFWKRSWGKPHLLWGCAILTEGGVMTWRRHNVCVPENERKLMNWLIKLVSEWGSLLLAACRLVILIRVTLAIPSTGALGVRCNRYLHHATTFESQDLQRNFPWQSFGSAQEKQSRHQRFCCRRSRCWMTLNIRSNESSFVIFGRSPWKFTRCQSMG